MTVTSTPIFGQAPKNKSAAVTAATTDYTGATTTNIVSLYAAGANGGKVAEITITVPVTSVAGEAQVWVDVGGSGALYLYDTFPISAVTVSTTVAPYRYTKQYDNFILAPSSNLKVGVSVINNPTHFSASVVDF